MSNNYGIKYKQQQGNNNWGPMVHYSQGFSTFSGNTPFAGDGTADFDPNSTTEGIFTKLGLIIDQERAFTHRIVLFENPTQTDWIPHWYIWKPTIDFITYPGDGFDLTAKIVTGVWEEVILGGGTGGTSLYEEDTTGTFSHKFTGPGGAWGATLLNQADGMQVYVLSGNLNQSLLGSSYGGVVGGSGNVVDGLYPFIGGGQNNTSRGTSYSTIINGNNNLIHTVGGQINSYSVIINGNNNILGTGSASEVSYSFIGGGGNHIIYQGKYNVIVGGNTNHISDSGINISEYSFIGNGSNNTISNNDYSFIGTGLTNLISSGFFGTIVNGSNNNIIGGNFGFIGCGENNTQSSAYGFIGGGNNNIQSGGHGVIIGGMNNIQSATGGVVGGGETNNNSGLNSVIVGGNNNTVTIGFSFIGGGQNNIASGLNSFIGGGGSAISTNGNEVHGDYSTIVGGFNNVITLASNYGFIGGGSSNNITTNTYITISGGLNNLATGQYSIIGGGLNNINGGSESTLSGGNSNTITALGVWGTICGGKNNITSEDSATVLGGRNNTANVLYGVVGGTGAVLLDGGRTNLSGDAGRTYTFLYRKSAGVWFGLEDGTGDMRIAIGASYLSSSSIRYKSNVFELNTIESFDQINRLKPVSYNIKKDIENNVSNPKLHLGFIAEEVHKVLPEAVSYDKDSKPIALDYNKFTPVIVSALQKTIKNVSDLSETISEVDVAVNERLTAIEKNIEKIMKVLHI